MVINIQNQTWSHLDLELVKSSSTTNSGEDFLYGSYVVDKEFLNLVINLQVIEFNVKNILVKKAMLSLILLKF